MNYRNILRRSKRVVIKVGTTQITREGEVALERIQALADEIVGLIKKGLDVLLVSSGAVSAGIARTGLQAKKGLSIPYKQAAAAIGQTRLMQIYSEVFARHGINCGQVLLTRDVMNNRERYLNASHTLRTLLKIGALPIINENDTMVVDEIKVGDNDRLAAMVAELVEADLLILLSDVEGFYTDWPDPDKRRLVHHLQTINEALRAQASDEESRYSTGGMKTKLEAAEMVARRGIQLVLASGQDFSVIRRILAGEEVGTFFEAKRPELAGRKNWILTYLEPRGRLILDEGAREAILKRGKSLLPGGIRSICGDFAAGDGIELAGPDEKIFARGITNYGREDLEKIIGKKTRELAGILGSAPYDEVVHRDNLARL